MQTKIKAAYWSWFHCLLRSVCPNTYDIYGKAFKRNGLHYRNVNVPISSILINMYITMHDPISIIHTFVEITGGWYGKSRTKKNKKKKQKKKQKKKTTDEHDKRFSGQSNLDKLRNWYFYLASSWSTYESQREKTYLLTCAPYADSKQPTHQRSMIRVFVDFMKKLYILGYPKCVSEDFDQTVAHSIFTL